MSRYALCRKASWVAAAGLVAPAISGHAQADDFNFIAGPITLNPSGRIVLDCPRQASAPRAVFEVTAFGTATDNVDPRLSADVKWKIKVADYPQQPKQDLGATEQITSSYNVTLGGPSFLPGYYALVVRNTNPFAVKLQNVGIVCR